jgi:hypothetical protein
MFALIDGLGPVGRDELLGRPPDAKIEVALQRSSPHETWGIMVAPPH